MAVIFLVDVLVCMSLEIGVEKFNNKKILNSLHNVFHRAYTSLNHKFYWVSQSKMPGLKPQVPNFTTIVAVCVG